MQVKEESVIPLSYQEIAIKEESQVCVFKPEPQYEGQGSIDAKTVMVMPDLHGFIREKSAEQADNENGLFVTDVVETEELGAALNENLVKAEELVLTGIKHEGGCEDIEDPHKSPWPTENPQVIHDRGLEVVGKSEPREDPSMDSTFVCSLCGRGFATKQNLMIHMRIHTGHTPYVCSKCGKSFKRSDRLAEHSKSHWQTHKSLSVPKKTASKSFSCDQCGKTFGKHSYLLAHQRGHFNIRSHECNLCAVTFIHLSDLRRHMRGHMSRPHVCKECGQKFRRADTLRKHERVHSGERPFCCTSCGKTYRHQESLRQHIKRHKKTTQ